MNSVVLVEGSPRYRYVTPCVVAPYFVGCSYGSIVTGFLGSVLRRFVGLSVIVAPVRLFQSRDMRRPSWLLLSVRTA